MYTFKPESVQIGETFKIAIHLLLDGVEVGVDMIPIETTVEEQTKVANETAQRLQAAHEAEIATKVAEQQKQLTDKAIVDEFLSKFGEAQPVPVPVVVVDPVDAQAVEAQTNDLNK